MGELRPTTHGADPDAEKTSILERWMRTSLSFDVDARADKDSEPAGGCPYRLQRHCPQSGAKHPGFEFATRWETEPDLSA